jgi:hypothetical protein
MRRLLTRSFLVLIVCLAVHGRAEAGPIDPVKIGTFEWIDCGGLDETSDDFFAFNCDVDPATFFRVTNLSGDFAGQPDFPSDATAFSNASISYDSSQVALPDVAPFSGVDLFENVPLPTIVSLALSLDAYWIGALTLPSLSAPNTGPAPIEFLPSSSTPVPEPASALTVAAGASSLAVSLVALRRRRRQQ